MKRTFALAAAFSLAAAFASAQFEGIATFKMTIGSGPEQKGGLLVARVGKGRYVYTGLAFFRQLPAGVPGAYRLLANLLAWK